MGVVKGLIKKIVHVLSIICYILILVYAIVCIPLIFGYHPMVVLSGSMEPTYKIGSVIYYKNVPEKELKVGDVITFTMNDKYISHRIANVENGDYTTKGDSNNIVDVNKIRYENIKGKVAEKSIPYIGYYVKFINENLIITIVLIIIILISEFLISNSETFDIDKKNGRSRKYGRKEENE